MRGVESIEVEATGQRLIFRDADAEAVVFESFLPPQAPGLVPDCAGHEQRFEVLAGTLCFSVNGTETLLTAGGRLTVPRGTTHPRHSRRCARNGSTHRLKPA